jgi:hypothetical protein
MNDAEVQSEEEISITTVIKNWDHFNRLFFLFTPFFLLKLAVQNS